MRYKVLSIAITLFWLTMMTSLVVKHVLPERQKAQSTLVEADVLASQWSDIQEWSWVRQNDTTFGAMMVSITKRTGEPKKTDEEPPIIGYRVVQNAEMQIPLIILKQRIRLKMTLDLNRDFTVSKFVASLQAPPFSLDCAGFVMDNNTLFVRISRNSSDTLYRSMPLKRPLSLLAAIRPMLTRQFALAVGQNYAMDVINPLSGASMGKATIKVAASEPVVLDGKTYEAFRLDSTYADFTRHSWVTKEGMMLRRELYKNIALERAFRPDVLAKYPELEKPLKMPEFDVEAFLMNIQYQSKGVTQKTPDSFQVLEELLGSIN